MGGAGDLRDGLGAGAIGHEPLDGGGDVQVLVTGYEPRWELLPGRRAGGQSLGESGMGDRSLRRGHERRLLGRYVRRELVVELLAGDRELVASGCQRVGGERAGERAA